MWQAPAISLLHPGSIFRLIHVVEELLKAVIWLKSDTGLLHIAFNNDTGFLQVLLGYRYESVIFMLDKGLSIDVSHAILNSFDSDPYCSSAIELAIRIRNLDSSKLLVARGFSPEQKDLDFARQNGYTEESAILSIFDTVELSDIMPIDHMIDHVALWAPQDARVKVVPLSLPLILSPEFEVKQDETHFSLICNFFFQSMALRFALYDEGCRVESIPNN
ncbi:Ankyrin repeat protein [Penicillium angulare]|uniref:Ankyrin repeat protein n=1 Tax=Penicillium angulare TaxID=116970 RepID=UPI002542232F|nr:Ankyrin repeat protein [Penicillium angulare]KAJ5291342.1 Ankyrin repeat protein [Penicillium angulare]